MYQQIYCEINLLCIGILIYILFKIRKSIDKRASNLELIKMMIALLFIIASDVIWVIFDGNSNPAARFISYLSSATYMAFSGLIGYFSLTFTQCKLGIYVKQSPIKKAVVSFPVIFLFVISYGSYFNNLMFTITKDGAYERGDLYFVQPAVPYAYFVMSLVHILIELRKTNSFQKKSELYTLISFFVFPIIGGILGIVFPGLPITWPLTVISVIFIFSNFQSYETLTDGLAGLNNRRNFNKFLNQQVSSKSNYNHIALLIIDIDSFKVINDTYGHFEGDKALKAVANMLIDIDSSEPKKSFIARYGGDEFSIIYNYGTKDDICTFVKKINEYNVKLNEDSKRGYDIYLSSGFETLSDEGASDFESLISGADENMYIEKSKNKANRLAKNA